MVRTFVDVDLGRHSRGNKGVLIRTDRNSWIDLEPDKGDEAGHEQDRIGFCSDPHRVLVRNSPGGETILLILLSR